ncbi:MAG: transglutaminase family protein [Sphingobium sp.]|nr:transglutaminase family protein [Sphingobium sp.]MCP5398123.1 transglutaminase family protein [Sphingomonas sp.]
MIYKVRHVTEVRYAAMVQLARFNLRLKPADWQGQRLLDYQLTVKPRPVSVSTGEDAYVVNHSRILIREPISQLHIESRFTVEVSPPPAPDPSEGPTLAELRRMALDNRDLSKLGPASYLYASPLARMEQNIGQWAGAIIAEEQSIVGAGMALMNAIYRDFAYDDDATKADTPPIEAFRKRRGVCQDFAHIMIIAARALAIPAAYVSGYLRTIPPPGAEKLVGADATHAWVNLWCGEALGWVGFDPTNNMITQSDHIFTGMGRDYGDVAPVDGVFLGNAGQNMTVSVDVDPVT